MDFCWRGDGADIFSSIDLRWLRARRLCHKMPSALYWEEQRGSDDVRDQSIRSSRAAVSIRVPLSVRYENRVYLRSVQWSPAGHSLPPLHSIAPLSRFLAD